MDFFETENLFTGYLHTLFHFSFRYLDENLKPIYIYLNSEGSRKFFKFIMESNVPNFSSSCGALKVVLCQVEGSAGA